MKKTSLLPLVLALVAGLLAAAPSYGQDSRALYLELLGASNGAGINYDARFNRDSSSGFGWRTGVGFGYRYSSIGLAYDFSDNARSRQGDVTDITITHVYDQCFRTSIPLEINYLLGKGPSKLDLGAGGIFCADLYTAKDGAKPQLVFGATPYLSGGYRLVTAKHFVLRAGLISTFSFRNGDFSFWPYISFGRSF